MDSVLKTVYEQTMNDADKQNALHPAMPAQDTMPHLHSVMPEPLMDEPYSDHVLLLCMDTAHDTALADALSALARQTDFAVQYHIIVEDAAQSLPTIEARHFVCMLTSTQAQGLALLRHALHSPARYIGLAAQSGGGGGRSLLEALRTEDIAPAEIACVRCPAGLPIGAHTIQEQAVAILAELIAARAGRMPRPLGRAKILETP